MTPWLIRYLRRLDMVVKDQNKEGKPLVPISGGMSVFAGFFAGLMMFLFIRTFVVQEDALVLHAENLTPLLAALSTILIITFVGFLDDLLIDRAKNASTGLRQWQKPLLTLTAAIPLMVINAGSSKMYVPFLGVLNFGILYPLLFIPVGVVGAANMVNLLAGLNGLEAGLALVYIGMLGLYAYVNQAFLAALLAMLAFAAVLAFFFYNKYPAKILPGDSLTYFLGGILACIAIIGNLEKAALISSVPFFIEFVLKARSNFKAQSYGYYYQGRVKHDSPKIYSLTHLFARSGKYTERQITFFILLIQLFFSSLIWFI